MNKMIIVGNLTRDPEMTYKENGVALTKFGVATNSGKGRDGKERQAEFHNIVVWGVSEGKDGLAGTCAQYLHKGSKVCIEGEHQTYQFEGKEGQKIRGCQIVARSVEFLSPKESKSSTGSEDDIPA